MFRYPLYQGVGGAPKPGRLATRSPGTAAFTVESTPRSASADEIRILCTRTKDSCERNSGVVRYDPAVRLCGGNLNLFTQAHFRLCCFCTLPVPVGAACTERDHSESPSRSADGGFRDSDQHFEGRKGGWSRRRRDKERKEEGEEVPTVFVMFPKSGQFSKFFISYFNPFFFVRPSCASDRLLDPDFSLAFQRALPQLQPISTR